MVNLSRTALRGFAGVAAAAFLAGSALPNASAAGTVGTADPVIPALQQPTVAAITLPAEAPPPGTGLTTKSSATNVVQYNRIYKSPPITPSKCREVNVSLRTAAGVQAYASKLWTCLYAAWAVPLKAGGFAYKVKPKLVVHTSSSVATYCGTVANPTGLYCSARGGTIYIPASQIIAQWKQNPTMARAWLSQMVGHEYGHHIQNMTGIMAASYQRRYAFSTNAAKLEESRRLELQASCFSAAYLGADKRYYPMSGGLMTAFNYLVTHMGDQPGHARDHGAPKNHAFWSTMGFNAKHTYTVAGNCNTYRASSAYVA
ncbi:neutral zinc metallopeptidase [Kribbella sp. NPDC026611]|uniref:neutral zinc metallopeptidase n=1 Tax=Kribbella sp. NPDC026611 TaxID=3154911 RepID=UPI003401D0F7